MTSPNSTFEDEISAEELIGKIRSFVRIVWAEWRTVRHSAMIAVAISVFVAFGSEEEFSATTRLVPYRGGAGGASGLAGLVGLAGIRLPAGATEQTIAVELYPEVAETQDFRIIVAETPIRFGSLDRNISSVQYFRDFRKTPLTEMAWSYTAGLPSKLLALASASIPNEKTSTINSDTMQSIVYYSPEYLGLVNSLAGRLKVSVDKKTTIITISASMPDPYAAADLVRITADRLTERIAEYESRKATEQFRFIDDQYKQARARFERAQRDLATFFDRNRALMSATAKIDQERLQREYDLSFEVYQQLSRELEQARIKMNQDTPVFTFLERVVVPNKKNAPRRGRIVLVGVLLGVLGGIGVIIGRKLVVASQLMVA